MNTLIEIIEKISNRLDSIDKEKASTDDSKLKSFLEIESKAWTLIRDELEWNNLSTLEKHAYRISLLAVSKKTSANQYNYDKSIIHIYEIISMTYPYLLSIKEKGGVDEILHFCDNIKNRIDLVRKYFLVDISISQEKIESIFKSYYKDRVSNNIICDLCHEKVDLLYKDLLELSKFIDRSHLDFLFLLIFLNNITINAI